LRFAERAKKIKNAAKINTVRSLESLEKIVASLTEQLEDALRGAKHTVDIQDMDPKVAAPVVEPVTEQVSLTLSLSCLVYTSVSPSLTVAPFCTTCTCR